MNYYVYSDVDQNLEKNFVYDLTAIKQSIYNILTTPKGTRMFFADFGSRIESILFEINDIGTEFLLFNEIVDALSTWEPRCVLDIGSSRVFRSPDKHTFIAILQFQIRGLEPDRFEYAIGFRP